MNVEKFKYVIWAKDIDRAITFYKNVFNGEIINEKKLGIKNIYSPLIILSDQIFITDEKANIYRLK